MASNTVSFSVGDTGFTRSGHAYRIICTDCGGDWPVIALIKHDDPLHGEVADKYTSLGHWVDDDDESPNDLSPPSPGFLPGF